MLAAGQVIEKGVQKRLRTLVGLVGQMVMPLVKVRGTLERKTEVVMGKHTLSLTYSQEKRSGVIRQVHAFFLEKRVVMARRTYAQETTGPIMETNTEMIQVFVLFSSCAAVDSQEARSQTVCALQVFSAQAWHCQMTKQLQFAGTF